MEDVKCLGVGDRRAAVVDDTRDKIARDGWAVIGVFPTPGDPDVPFAYTVGLTGKQLPELAIYGLPTGLGHQVLNMVARQMVESDEPLLSGQQIDGVLDGDGFMTAVEMTNTHDLTMVREVYGAVGGAVQVCWPDRNGLLPWERVGDLGDEDQPVHGVAPAGRAVYRAVLLPVETVQELADYVAEVPKGALTVVDPQADTNLRATWGARALVGYAGHRGAGCLTAEVATAASDMLADVRHLFDALGLDWDFAVSICDRNYRAEILGEL